MTIEYIRYRVPADRSAEFEDAYRRAAAHLAAAPECRGIELTRCEEEPESYVVRLTWTSTHDHLDGFRKGPNFPPFFAQIRGFVDDIQEMRHYTPVEIGDAVPTLYEWAGGADAIEKLFQVFYERVPQDELLAPLFAGMDPDHAKHVAAWVGEVFGGPRVYSEHRGGHPHMVAKHLGRGITEQQRRRWVALLQETADEVGLPDDPEFRSAFVGYLEWGTRMAVIFSRPGAKPNQDEPMPEWGWGNVLPWQG
ncbi:group II truncated hemoglobin [Actinophytocola gossypii]|uniref:Group II truncated hemoglobin n=1 Tax=Actinophytocola gossypii TaxID=2812003 RepID=A0ABT2J2G5_9PSEU|nr:antibiotic biosynthesis monooxygenase [Actinophytocola gossypii]MCT2581861.1 group II truncated hemoglobin [Actinophytocola gossypii]